MKKTGRASEKERGADLRPFSFTHDDAFTALIALDTALESIETGDDGDGLAEERNRYATLARKLAQQFRDRGWEGGVIDRYSRRPS